MERKYLSDEELDQMIKDIEAEPLHPAPEYLKNMILDKAKAYDRSGHMMSAGTQLLTYSVKIMAAAAAAAIVVLTVPVMDKAQSLDYMEQSAQAELERMRDRAADRELAQIQDRTETINRANARRAMEEKLDALTRQDPGRSFFSEINILDWFHEIIK